MYVLVQGGTATAITIPQVRKLHPEVSFPAGDIPDALLAEFGVYPAVAESKPSYNPATHKIVEDGYYNLGGTWTLNYAVEALTDQEQAAVVQAKLDELAADRFAHETGGYVWTDAQGDSWWFSTTLEAQSKIEANRRTAESGLRPEGGVWKCGEVTPGGIEQAFRPTSNAEIQEIGLAIHAFVQKCYTAEGNAAAKVLAGDLSADFATEFAAL